MYLSRCLVWVFSLGVLPALFHFVSLFLFLSFSLFQCWEFGHLIRNCPRSSVNASSSDRPPNRGRPADPEWSASDVDVDVVETDEYPLIDGCLGSGVEFGRLKQCISYWESTICDPQFVLGLFSEGNRLPFVRFPDKCHLRNNRSAVRHPQFVEEAISKLLLIDCIQEHCEPLYCVNPLSVAEGKKLRLVIDLRHVNPCLFKHSFKYEDLHCLSKVFEQNFWFFYVGS